MSTLNHHIELFQSIGRLIHSVAAADKTISLEEKRAISIIVRELWMTEINLDNPNIWDACSQIEIEFELSCHREYKAEDSFSFFKNHFLKNRHLFTEKINELIWKSVNKVALAKAGYNKSELVKLSQIKILLSQ